MVQSGRLLRQGPSTLPNGHIRLTMCIVTGEDVAESPSLDSLLGTMYYPPPPKILNTRAESLVFRWVARCAQLWRHTDFYVRSDSDASQRAAPRETQDHVSALDTVSPYTGPVFTHINYRVVAHKGTKTRKRKRWLLFYAEKTRGELLTKPSESQSFSGPSKTLFRNSLSTELGCYRGPLMGHSVFFCERPSILSIPAGSRLLI